MLPASSIARFIPLLEQSLSGADLRIDDGASIESAAVLAAVMREGWSAAAAESIRRSLLSSEAVDSLGHRRPVYWPVKLYAISQALRSSGAAAAEFREQMTAIATSLLETLPQLRAQNSPPHVGWSALAVASIADLFELQIGSQVESFFDRMVESQQSTGAWLSTTAADNIEMHGYDELVLLHAITSYRVLSRKHELDEPIAANAAFQARELQPDHATNQPWALHGLALHEAALPLAEQLLHAAIAQQPSGMRGLPVVLLADALYGLRSIESVTD